MSTPTPGGSGAPEDKPKGFSRLLQRAKTVLKSGSSSSGSSKRRSMVGASTLAPVKPTSDPTQSSSVPVTSPSAAAVTPAQPDTTNVLAPAAVRTTTPPTEAAKPTSTPTRPRSGKTAAENSKLQEEKARILFAEYNMTLDAGEWTPPFKGDTIRVEKKVRMRIHRTCHRCQTTFGVERICSNCKHTRCKKCPRFPGSGLKDKKGKRIAGGGIAVDEGYKTKDPAERKPQKSRRVCHKCQTPFPSRDAPCDNCKHVRCTQCPRDPPSKSEMIYGLPPEEPKDLPTRWACHACTRVSPDSDNFCATCGHGKCNECPRHPGGKSKPPEEGVAGVEEGMRGLVVGPQAAAA